MWERGGGSAAKGGRDASGGGDAGEAEVGAGRKGFGYEADMQARMDKGMKKTVCLAFVACSADPNRTQI